MGVAVFLCLSVLMAIIAFVRVIRLRYHDFTWLAFWMQVEASVAILSVSLTAFPGIFATEGSQGGLKNAKLRNFSIFQKLAFRK